MAYSLENTTDLTALGDAIRAKTGGTATMTVAEMATAVAGISGGGSSGTTLPSNYITFTKTGNDVVDIDIYGSYGDGDYIYPTNNIYYWALIALQLTSTVVGDTNVNVNFHSPITAIPPGFASLNGCGAPGSHILNVNLSNTVMYIEHHAFDLVGRLNLTLPTNLRVIGDYAFQYTEVSYTTFPSLLREIGSYAFRNCPGLTQLEIPYQNITNIKNYAFRSCSNLTSVSFVGDRDPDASALTMGNNVFTGCSNLTDIYVPWSQGDVANAPWGATNATIHYDYVSGE